MKFRVADSFDFIWLIGYPLLLYLCIQAAVEFYMETKIHTADRSYVLWAMLVSAVLTAFILGILYKKASGMSPGRGDLNWSAFGWAGITAVGSCILVNTLAAYFFSDLDTQAGAWIYECPFYLQLAVIGAAVPMAEELVFRGLGYMQMRTRLSFWQAAIASAVYFAIYHVNLIQGFYAFILGFIMAWLCEQYHSLRLSVWFHMAANISSIVITNLIPGEQDGGLPVWPKLLLSAGLVSVGIYKIREDVSKREIVIDSDSVL
ncbi:MAG: lysostaphin resistance A-like protein [Lachnospiraceae bacterium]